MLFFIMVYGGSGAGAYFAEPVCQGADVSQALNIQYDRTGLDV